MKSFLTFAPIRVASLLGALVFLVSSCGTTGESQDSKVRISSSGSKEYIRHQVLNYTPIGSTYTQVQGFVQHRLKYPGAAYYDNAPATRPLGPGYQSVGVRSVFISLGGHGVPFFSFVVTYVTWAFDKNDKLIDVIVLKERDSL
jgi:hypothetical protein